ncbi:MAG: tRNA (N(6)-L-threonylcarbamoyladenosine(37)-C(2))-methylthiotransferase MtaB [Methylococcales bacterium]|nr:tRNA (N(6)-L-threonylcarbamoyladenosine(37)-C(2))-methylthiotransferase MtaB [Methylococcales bacterium]
MLVYLKTLGCRLNEAELETWAQAFQKAGHQITRELDNAHIVIINSCAVTADASRKSRQLIRKIHRGNPQAKLVISGCYVTLNEDEAAQLLGVDLVVSNKDKNQLVKQTLSLLNLESMPAMATEPGETSLFSRGRQRAFVKVQDGCRYRCTFCIVTVARGEEASRALQDIIDEINSLHLQGINEVILTGVHLGGYGGEIKSDLSTLIETILNQTNIPRLRLGSLEPWELPDGFFSLFKNPRLMPHLHLPLQSGSDSVLRRMARRCKTDEFANIVKQAREQIPHFNVTTDIIVGFPGETEQEWNDSFEFIKKIGFGHIHIFTYSSREGTKAATLPNPVNNKLKKQRSKQLHVLAEEMKQAFVTKNFKQTFPVLWEGHKQPVDNEKQMVFGYTPNYLQVACEIPTSETIENKIIETTLVSIADERIKGRLEI